MKSWRWHTSLAMMTSHGLPITHLYDGRNRQRATIWQNSRTEFVWHTWDTNGTGGENAEDSTLNRAKDSCVAALVRQGWAPGGWKVTW